MSVIFGNYPLIRNCCEHSSLMRLFLGVGFLGDLAPSKSLGKKVFQGITREIRNFQKIIAIGADIYRSPEALWARNPQKVSKWCSRASRPGVSKKCRKSAKCPEKESKRLQHQCSGTFSTLFLTLPTGRPGKSFLRLFGDSGARGCGDSCIWGLHTQKK